MAFLSRWVGLVLFPLVGCSASVAVDDEDCGPPLPGPCPGWECVDGEWVLGAAVDCEEPACPTSRPEDGTACFSVGQECSYTEDVPCGPTSEVTARCTEAGWTSNWLRCEPEPTCPLDMPAVGSDCSEFDYAYFCQYEVPCGRELGLVTMSCFNDGQVAIWEIDEGGECLDCGSLSTASACLTSSACQWLTPGCNGDRPPVNEGCYPVGNCQLDFTCPNPDMTCDVYSYDPCWNSECDSCGAEIGICEFPK